MYATYLGGTGTSTTRGRSIAVDGAGSAYVTGDTDAADFPTTSGTYDETWNGSTDAFVARLNATGSALTWSTYLGGPAEDRAVALELHSDGTVSVAGRTAGAGFPTTGGAPDTTYGGGVSDGFVSRLDPAGGTLVSSTYLGGTGSDQAYGLGVDVEGSAYVAGETSSPDFPLSHAALGPQGGPSDAFLVKLGQDGAPGWSVQLGGTSSDRVVGVAVDAGGNAYLTGRTYSSDFPVTPGAYDRVANGPADAFVTKVDSSGATALYSTLLGGAGEERGVGILVDDQRGVYLTGETRSSDFPVTPGALDGSFNGDVDGFIARLDAAGSALLYSTYVGGGLFDEGNGIAVDTAGNVYVAGGTASADFPSTGTAHDSTFNSATGEDAYALKLSLRPARLVAYETRPPGGKLDVAVYDLTVGAPVPLPGLNQAVADERTPSLSADGNLIAFTSSRSGAGDVYLYDRSRSSLVTLARLNAAGSLDSSPSISPSGDRIAFDSARAGAGDVYLYNRTTSALETLRGLNTKGYFEGFPSLDGSFIVFESSRSGGGDIYLHDRSRSRLVSLPGLNSSFAEGSPSIADEGRLIAFESYRSGTADILLYDRSTSSVVELPGLNTGFAEETPWLSLDGRFLAFSSDRSGSDDLYLYDRLTSSLGELSGVNTSGEELSPSIR
ncbi:MAG: SBBP repeat-containing protein [Gemmatimonadetes bacterium]|nr:SBBP repeat-containing protein [Gemmatimonadota bacterium]